MKKVLLGILGMMSIVSCSKNDDVLEPQFEGVEVDIKFERLGYQQWFEGDCDSGETYLWTQGDVTIDSSKELLIGDCTTLTIDGDVFGEGVIVVYGNSTLNVTGTISNDVYIALSNNSTINENY